MPKGIFISGILKESTKKDVVNPFIPPGVLENELQRDEEGILFHVPEPGERVDIPEPSIPLVELLVTGFSWHNDDMTIWADDFFGEKWGFTERDRKWIEENYKSVPTPKFTVRLPGRMREQSDSNGWIREIAICFTQTKANVLRKSLNTDVHLKHLIEDNRNHYNSKELIGEDEPSELRFPDRTFSPHTTYWNGGAPPPGGNVTLTDDIIINGTCAKGDAGWVVTATYDLTVNANVTFTMQNTTTISSLTTFIMEEGSSWLFSGVDLTFTLFVTAGNYATILFRGLTGNHITIGGTGGANRPTIILNALYVSIFWNYVDVQNENLGSAILYTTGTMTGFVGNCTWTVNHSTYQFQSVAGNSLVCYNLDFTTNAYNYCLSNQISNEIILIDCVFRSVHATARIVSFNATFRLIGNDVDTDEEDMFYVAGSYGINNVFIYKKTTITEDGAIDFSVTYKHDSYSSLEAYTDDFQTMMFRSVTGEEFGPMGGKESSSGSVDIYLLSNIVRKRYRVGVAKVDISVNGGSGSKNDEYTIVMAKDGYRTQEYQLYAGDVHNFEFVAQTDFDDIITDLDDIKGTGFVKDTDSLVDLSHQAGAKGTDDIHDDLVTVDGIVDDILVDTGTTLPAEHTTLQADLDNPGQYKADVSALASQASVDTVDANVDAILTDTGTTLPAAIADLISRTKGLDDIHDDQVTIGGIVAAILVDTGTTLPATLTTMEGKIDTVDIVVDANYALLAHATYGLAALKTLIDNCASNVEIAKVILYNKMTIDETSSVLRIWNDAGNVILYEWPLTNRGDAGIVLSGQGPVNRGKQTK